MDLNKKAAKKSRAHTRYVNAAGTRVPGCTTITGVMDKAALVPWANKLGLQGIEVGKYVDELATIGTLAHYMIECHLKGEKPDLDAYSKDQIDTAENGYLKFLEWQKEVGFEARLIEQQMVSEKHQYGGTIDAYGIMKKQGDKKILCDIKTCKAVYDDHFTQVAGYDLLLLEHGYEVDEVHIIRVGRSEDEGFEDKVCHKLDLHVKRFLICRDLYEVNKEIKRK